MYLRETRGLLKKNKPLIKGTVKMAKPFLDKGQITKDELQKIIDIDPSKQKKYTGWLTKVWVTEKPDEDLLKSSIEEFDTFLKRGKVEKRDINQYKSFKELEGVINTLNQSGDKYSNRELEKDYEVILDNSDFLIICPHSHEASRKLGLSQFAYRSTEDGKKDSSWCTTYKAPDHFNTYYYSGEVTFYYIKIKSPKVIQKLQKAFPNRYKPLIVSALVVYKNGAKELYDGDDKVLSEEELAKFLKITGLK